MYKRQHIFRGPDGAFYLSMTDLHMYAQRDGYRDTEWERDGKEYGWGNNLSLIHIYQTIWNYDGETDWQDMRHNREIGNCCLLYTSLAYRPHRFSHTDQYLS